MTVLQVFVVVASAYVLLALVVATVASSRRGVCPRCGSRFVSYHDQTIPPRRCLRCGDVFAGRYRRRIEP